MIITKHAQERWTQRFPGMCLDETIRIATKPLSKKLRNHIKKGKSKEYYIGHPNNNRYMRSTRDGIVFVLEPPNTVITVMDLRVPPQHISHLSNKKELRHIKLRKNTPKKRKYA